MERGVSGWRENLISLEEGACFEIETVGTVKAFEPQRYGVLLKLKPIRSFNVSKVCCSLSLFDRDNSSGNARRKNNQDVPSVMNWLR